MRRIIYMALSALLALPLSMGVFAKDSHTDAGTFDLAEPARIGSTVLQPGHYRVEWVGPNEDVQVTILQGDKVVATTRGRVIEKPQAPINNSVMLTTTSDEEQRVEEIDFSNRKDALFLFEM